VEVDVDLNDLDTKSQTLYRKKEDKSKSPKGQDAKENPKKMNRERSQTLNTEFKYPESPKKTRDADEKKNSKNSTPLEIKPSVERSQTLLEPNKNEEFSPSVLRSQTGESKQVPDSSTKKGNPKETPKSSPKESPKDSPKSSPKEIPKESPKSSPKNPKESPKLSPKEKESSKSTPKDGEQSTKKKGGFFGGKKEKEVHSPKIAVRKTKSKSIAVPEEIQRQLQREYSKNNIEKI